MRIIGTNRPTGTVSRTPAHRSGASGTFSPDTAGGTARSEPGARPQPVQSLDALLSLQGYADDETPRRRAVKRGRHILDALDEIKIATLSGTVPEAVLASLGAALATREDSGRPDIEAVIDEIELRARVELAKRGIF